MAAAEDHANPGRRMGDMEGDERLVRLLLEEPVGKPDTGS